MHLVAFDFYESGKLRLEGAMHIPRTRAEGNTRCLLAHTVAAHRSGIGRPQFVVTAGLAALGGPAFLTPCSGDDDAKPAAPAGLRLASPDSPVT